MAYNPYTAIQKVYNAKVAYGNATTDEERKRQQELAESARAELRRYGYSDIADAVSADGATADAVKKYMGTYAKTGKTATRPYLYSLGQSYGLSNADVDKIIGWDSDTGELSIGGKKVGAPDAEYDGVSYWNDTSVLDNAFSDYATRSGLTRSKELAVNQENENLFKMYKQEYDDLKNTNPFTTEEAKAILAKFDMSGLKARESETASGAGSNGGNIDSFAAANAMRQQSELINQGQMTVLSAHQQKLDHARALLSDMGVNIDRVYNQDETSKNNAVSRDVAISEVTGYSTDSQLKASSSLWNADGSLADTDLDYQSKINEIEILYKSATNESDKQSYALALKLLEMARNDKIDQTGRSEGKTYKYQSLIENANTKLNKEQIAQADRVLNAQQLETDKTLQATKEDNAAQRQHELNMQDKQIQGEKDLLDKQINADKEQRDGEMVDVVNFQNIGTIDAKKFKETYKGDAYGLAALTALQRHANSEYGGYIEVKDAIDFLVKNSKTHKTDKAQLQKVLSYLGIGSRWLDNVEDAMSDDVEKSWEYGVTYIK